MGPWQILGEALLAPLRRVDLVVRYFWQLLVLLAVVSTISLSTLFFIFSGIDGNELKVVFRWLPLVVLLGFLVTPILIAVTVIGLVKWHRHYTLRETDGGSKADRTGRGGRLFWQWFLVGLGFVAAVFLTQILIGFPLLYIGLSGEIQGPDIDVWSDRAQQFKYSAVIGMVIVALSCLVFALIFKRRSVRLAYVAADARESTLPELDRFAIRNGWLSWVLAAALALPMILINLLALGIGHMFGLDELQELIKLLLDGRAAENPAPLVPFIMVISSMYLVQIFYPMLVFATTVSLYYREHVRTPLLESLAADADQTASAS